MKRIANRRIVLAAVVLTGVAMTIAAGVLIRRHGGLGGPASAGADTSAPGPMRVNPGRTFKILHIMSYHMPWVWTEHQLNGFKDALKGLDVEYRIIQMDAKRNSSPAWLQKVSAEARQTIESWKPDLVFTGDDAAQEYIGKGYVGKGISFVFCAVNADPEDYGFASSDNVTGVLEREHFVQSINLLKEIVPSVRKVAIITDQGKMWDKVIRRMKQQESELKDTEIVSYDVIQDYDQYKARVLDCQSKVDAIGLLGIFEFKDANGDNVPYQEVSRWTVENSRLPDFSYYEDRVVHGTLCAMTVSGYAQGNEAGKIARDVLVGGKKPRDFPMEPTAKGEPWVNLARAKQIGVRPSTSILLSAQVISDFAWDKK